MTRQRSSRRLPIDNDWQIEVDLDIDDAPLPGGTVATGFLSATPDGAAIHGTLSVVLVRQANQVTWTGTLTATNLTAQLNQNPYLAPGADVGARIWEVVVITGSSLRTTRWVRVYRFREI